MLKEAIEKIVSLASPEIRTMEGRTFSIGSDGYQEIRATPDRPEMLTLNSLDSLVKMVKTEGLQDDAPLYITIPNPTTVLCFAKFNRDDRCFRQLYYQANGTDIPGWGERVEIPFEEAMIALRTRFQETNDTTYALKLLSEITTGAKMTFNDNGIATTVMTKKGIDLQTNQPIRPIISLRPYRTFQEIEQPESQFLIRVSERGIAFIEADGGMWKLHARQAIKEFLEKEFAEEIHDGTVVVAL